MRKIIGGIAILVISLCQINALADEITAISIDPDTQCVTISGKIDLAKDRERVTLRVTKAKEEPSKQTVIYTYQVNTQEKGDYSFDFAMPDDAKEGYYDVYVTCADTNKSTFHYFGDVADVLKSHVNAAQSVTALKEFFEGNGNEGFLMFGMNTQMYDKLSDAQKVSVITSLYKTCSEISGYKTGVQLRDTFSQSLLITEILAASAKDALLLIENNLTQLMTDYTSPIGDAYGEYKTAYKSANDDVLTKAIEQLQKGNVESTADFWTSFNDLVVYNVISSTVYWTEVKSFIDENKDLINSFASVDWGKYNSACELVAKQFVGKEYSAAEEFSKALRTVVNSAQSSSNGSNSSSGSGGTGISSSSVKLPNVNDIQASNTDAVDYPSQADEKHVFSDIIRTPWASEAVEFLFERGMISGYEDNSFRPQNDITRGEFVSIVMRAFYGSEETTDFQYRDVSKELWSYSYIATATNLGIVNGIGDGFFGPDRCITRQDMALIVYNIMTKKDGLPSDEEYALFLDDSSISEYAYRAVNILKALSIINGDSDNNFNPTKEATRAEAAVVIYNLLNK